MLATELKVSGFKPGGGDGNRQPHVKKITLKYEQICFES
jgi:hypothetical protein